MEKIKINTLQDAYDYEGRRVRLYWIHDGIEYPRGAGILTIASEVSSFSGAEVIGVAPGTGSQGVGHGGINAVYLGKRIKVATDRGGIDAVYLTVPRNNAAIELLDTHSNADHYLSMVGKRIKVVARLPQDAALAADRGGVVTKVNATSLIGAVVLYWVTAQGGEDSLIVWDCGDGWADVEVVEAVESGVGHSTRVIPPLTLSEQLQSARADKVEKQREAEKAEDAKYPLPDGYKWISPDEIHDSYGTATMIDVFDDDDDHISGVRPPIGEVLLSIEDPDNSDHVISAPLSVVRALLDRYDNRRVPYSIEIERYCADIDHSFRGGDTIDLTFESGRVERAVIEYVDEDGDIFTINPYCWETGCSGYWVGRTDGRGVCKVTLVSRGGQ